jgi:nitrate reductase NapD
MNISGILVVTSPEHSGKVTERLQNMTGIDIHYSDVETGRIVITQEAASISAEVDGLKRIRALPDVILAEMSCHYFEDDRELMDAIPAEHGDEVLDEGHIPTYLKE